MLGRLSALAAEGRWQELLVYLCSNPSHLFGTGGPGVGKTTFMRMFRDMLNKSRKEDGAVVVCAPTGSAAHTAGGQTYHSYFGFGHGYAPELPSARDKAARLLNCSTTGPPMRQGATAGTSATAGDAVPEARWRRQRRWWPTGWRRGMAGREGGPAARLGPPEGAYPIRRARHAGPA